MGKEYNNVYVYEHTVKFCKRDDDGYELLNDDGSVKIFTAPNHEFNKLDFVTYFCDAVKVNDLEEE
jgi:hypothetical protein